MSEEEEDRTSKPEPEELDSLLGELDFTPDWARSEPGIQSEPPPRRGREDQGGRGPRAPGPSARRGFQGVRVKPRRAEGEGRGRGGPGSGPGGRGEGRGPPPPRLPVHVDFIPEKHRLSKVVKVVRRSQRVFPMEQIAQKFMEDPAFLSLKYTVKDRAPGGEEFVLYQCTANGMVFTDRSACVQYILDRGLKEYYEEETREVEPPSGNFVCVGRHRGSGKLIGPPNWHGYQRRMEEVRQEQAPGTSPEAFGRQVEMVHEEEAIEAWRKEVSVDTFYRPKQAKPAKRKAAPAKAAPAETTSGEPEGESPKGEGAAEVEGTGEAEGAAEVHEASEDSQLSEESETSEVSEPSESQAEAEPEEAEEPFSLSREEAEKEFAEEVLPDLMQQTRRAIMPGALLPKMADEALASMTEFHLKRERNRPNSIVFALRPAFKHMRLHLFRQEGELMVSGVEPRPLPEDQKVAPELRQVLDYVGENPQCNAKVALEALTESTGVDMPTLVSHFHWLIEKGHLLEYFNGTLNLPQAKTRRGSR